MSTVKEELERLIKENKQLMLQVRNQKKQIDIMEELNRDMYQHLMESQQNVRNYEHLTKTIFGNYPADG